MGDFDGQRVTVMGLGRFGGGVGAACWLAERGADVLATDLSDGATLGAALDPLRAHVDAGSVTLRLGEHNVSDFTDTDVVVVNPGVPRPWDNRFVRAARAAGVRCTTEIGLTVERLPERARVVGVTGTAGKSTTTSMIGAGLRAAGARVHVGGNLGGSLLEALDEIRPGDPVVLELSSAMLWWLGGQDGQEAGWSPGVAVVTNLAPNHIDWHASDEHYERCKRLILAHQRPGDAAVLGESLAGWPVADGVRKVVAGPGDFDPDPLTPGAHNRANASLALAACERVLPDARPDEMAHAIASFPGLPHRCCLVHTCEEGGAPIRFYNDSKCTVPGGVALGVQGVGEVVGGTERVHLIAGGSDKGVDLSPIGSLAGAVAGLYAIGATADAILRTVPREHGVRARRCADLPDALACVREHARPGHAVLLSPGCASFGEFRNFEHRGDEFARLVRERFPGGVPA
ncbi:MAG: Mur ligase family protein [Phycisphaerales bacterium JB040]